MYSIVHNGSVQFFREIISGGVQQGFFRPVGQLLILFLYQPFGLHAFGYRVIGVLILFLNATLVAYVAWKITDHEIISWTSGFLYILAFSIQIDTVLWIVGMYDILGAFFFFLSLALFLGKRIASSAVAYVLALFSKEATVVLPGLLFICGVLAVANPKENRPIKQNLLRSARAVLPHVVILCSFLLIRSAFLQPGGAGLVASNPYRIELSASMLFENATRYLYWCFGSFLPIGAPYLGKTFFLVAVTIALIFYFRKPAIGRPTALLLAGWFVIGLLPVLFLAQHAFRYYAVYSLPPVIVVVLDGLRTVAWKIRHGRAILVGLASVLVVFNLCYSYIDFTEIDNKGFDIPTVEGSNNLSRKAALVTMVHDYLINRHPTLPTGTALIFDWMPIAAFCNSAGPRIWYSDSTINAYEIQDVSIDSSGIRTERGKGPHLDLTKLILLDFHGVHLREARPRVSEIP